jgi:hypothetical protein
LAQEFQGFCSPSIRLECFRGFEPVLHAFGIC